MTKIFLPIRLSYFLLMALLLPACGITAIAVQEGEEIGQVALGKPVTRGKVRILSVIKLLPVEYEGLSMVELSGLAWSEDEQRLYALSDHGFVFHFRPIFLHDKLVKLKLEGAYALKGEDGKGLSWPYSDSEGLALLNANNGVQGDDQLLVSYELRPRIHRHDARGTWLGNLVLPAPLNASANYQSWNKSLEALAIHPRHGVMTMPEWPLLPDSERDDVLTIYDTQGNQWFLPHGEVLPVSALEAMPNGDLLMLQRANRIFGDRWKIVLSRVRLQDKNQANRETLAELSYGDVEMPVDNYEGLTHHKGNCYFMISDDNEHALQDAFLVYFEVLD